MEPRHQQEQSAARNTIKAPLSISAGDSETAKEVAAAERAKQVYFARLLLIGVAALYGTSFSLVKILNASVPVGIGSTLRFGMSALVSAPWLFRASAAATETRNNDNNNKNPSVFFRSPEWAAIVAGFEVGIWNSIGFMAQAIGLETTLASKSAFLCSLVVVIVPMLDRISGKRLKQREIVGATLALIGLGFLERDGASRGELLQFTKGDLASLLQPFAFGMAFWRTEKVMHKLPNQATRATAAELFAVFLGSLLYTAATDSRALLDFSQIQKWLLDPFILGSLVWSGVVVTAIGVYMETVSLKTLSAAETTLILSSEPVFGSFCAAVTLGETFGFDALMGGLLILTACVYSSLGPRGIRQLFSRTKLSKEEYSPEADMPFENLPLERNHSMRRK